MQTDSPSPILIEQELGIMFVEKFGAIKFQNVYLVLSILQIVNV